MNKIFIIALVGLLLVGSVSAYICISFLNQDEESDYVYNPATGETWNSVEEYVYRNKNMIKEEEVKK